MSKLEELIREFCPDGVEFKPIKEVYQRLKGTPITAAKMKEIQNDDGDVRIFAGGKTVIDTFEGNIPNANITRVPAVLVQSRGVIDAIYYERPFTFKNEMWAYTHQEKTSVKYLYYVLKNNMEKFREAASGMGSLPQISLKVTEDFTIPIPPLPVQCEIVRILDSFTELTAKLTAELTAELTARKKQYKYYSEYLLKNVSKNSVNMQLCDIYDFKYGKGNNIPKEGGAYPVYGGNGIVGYHNEYNSEDTPVIGHIGAYAGLVQWAKGKHFVTYNGVICRHKNKDVNKKFAYYLLLSQDFLSSQKGAQPFVSYDALKKPFVKIPPLAEQERIVSILDRFDTFCNDLTSGLPAEIEARQKQYEYYRDKLLTFQPLEKGGAQ